MNVSEGDMPTEGGTYARKTRGWFLPFLIIFMAMAYLSFLVSLPLLAPLAWSVLLSFIVYPLFSRMRQMMAFSRSGNVPAAIATGGIALLIVLPTVFAGYVAAREGMKLFESFSVWLSSADLSGGFDLSSLLPPFMAEKLKAWGEEYPMVASMAEQARDWLATHAVTAFRTVLGSTLTVAYYLAVIVVSCFFLIRDGSLIIGYLKDILPLREEEQDAFSAGEGGPSGGGLRRHRHRFCPGSSRSGGLVACRSRRPMFFGALMICWPGPFVGTALLWGPAGAYLLYAERRGRSLSSSLGIFVVSMADNLLPLFISGEQGTSTDRVHRRSRRPCGLGISRALHGPPGDLPLRLSPGKLPDHVEGVSRRKDEKRGLPSRTMNPSRKEGMGPCLF